MTEGGAVPQTFSFTLTLPRTAQHVETVQALCRHAATQRQLPDAAAADLIERVEAAVVRALATGGTAPCVLVFHCADDELRVTVEHDVVRLPLPA